MRKFTVEYYIIRHYERVYKSLLIEAKDWNTAAKEAENFHADRHVYVTSITEHRW